MTETRLTDLELAALRAAVDEAILGWAENEGNTGLIQAAKRALAKLEQSDRRGPKRERRAYRCPACKGWHLTSKQAGRNPTNG